MHPENVEVLGRFLKDLDHEDIGRATGSAVLGLDRAIATILEHTGRPGFYGTGRVSARKNYPEERVFVLNGGVYRYHQDLFPVQRDLKSWTRLELSKSERLPVEIKELVSERIDYAIQLARKFDDQ